jgi:hypothetical protein
MTKCSTSLAWTAYLLARSENYCAVTDAQNVKITAQNMANQAKGTAFGQPSAPDHIHVAGN